MERGELRVCDHCGVVELPHVLHHCLPICAGCGKRISDRYVEFEGNAFCSRTELRQWRRGLEAA